MRIFAVACALVLAGCGLALCFATLDRGVPAPSTMLFATAATAFGLVEQLRDRVG